MNILSKQGRREKMLNILFPIFIFGIMFGYPILTITTLLLGVQGTALSIAYRFIFLSLGIFMIGNAVMVRGGLRFVKSGLPFIFFWMVYALVLINDISIEEIRMRGKSAFYLYSFAFGSSMMTFVTCFFSGQFLRFNGRLIKQLFNVTFCANLLISIYLLKTGGLSVEALASRASIEAEAGNVLNPITIGQFGVFGLIAALAYLIVKKKRSLSRLSLTVGALLISTANIFLSASRGPILVGAIVLLLTGYFFYAHKKLTKILLLKSWLVISAGIIAFFVYVIPLLSSLRISIFFRLQTMLDQRLKGEKEVRDYEWESAIRQFKEYPILGDKYINDYDKYYPHNVYLEVLMSTGVVGGVFFFTGLVIGLYNVYLVYHSKSVARFALVTIVIAILLFRFTSGALHQTADLWAGLGILTCCNIKMNYDSRKGVVQP